MQNKNWKSKIKEHGLVLLLFTILTFALTYPVITRITIHTAGSGDIFHFLGLIWHVNRVLMSGGSISDIYHTDLLLYPHGASLTWHTLTLTNTFFIAFPITLFTDNLVLIYNILFLLSFILAGYGMYLLTCYLVKNKSVAFLVGFAYAFSPLHMAWGGGFLHMMSIQWTPLFFLFFFKMFEEKKMINVFASAIFLFLVALSSWYHLVFAFLMAVPYFFYKFFTNISFFNKYLFLRITTFLILFCIIMWPFWAPMITDYFERSTKGTPPLIRGIHNDISIFHYFLPSPLNTFFGQQVLKIFPLTRVPHSSITPGYVVILFSFLYLVKTRKNFFWFLLAVFFVIISILTDSTIRPLLHNIPFVGAMKDINRISFMALFSIFIFFAFALSHFLFKWTKAISDHYFLSKRATGKILYFFIFIALFLEYLAVPYGTTAEDRPEAIIYAKEMGQDIKSFHPILGNNFVVLEFVSSFLPSQFNLYWQTFHQKPEIGGEIARPKFEETETLTKLENITRTNDFDGFRKFLKDYNVGYVIFYGRIVRIEGEIGQKITSLIMRTPLKLVGMYPGEIYIFEVSSETYLLE